MGGRDELIASEGLLPAPNRVLGFEFRTKPDNLSFAREGTSFDVFATYAIDHHLTAAAAYADLGKVATFPKQRGILISLQGSF